MRTKGAKIAAKANRGSHGGQNKRDDVVRYPNGRIDYGGTEQAEDVMATAKTQRLRFPGVTAGNANSATAGTVLGRMLLQEEITEEQYTAGKEFERRRSAYLAAIQAPRMPRSGSDMRIVQDAKETAGDGAVRVRIHDEGGSAPAYVERCNAARARYSDVRREAMGADALGLMALEEIVCGDRMVETLVGPLRLACNRIARLLKIERGP